MAPEQTHPRRRDRSLEESAIRALLLRGEAGVLSAVLDGLPYSLPRLYVYEPDREAVYVHGAYGGETGRVLRQGEGGEGVPMNLTVYEMGRLLPDEEALEFGVEYASVVVTGRAVEVADRDEATRALDLIMRKYAPHLEPGRDYRPIAEEEVMRTSVVRIDIDSWSGKEKTEAPDFPGAYWFKDVR